LDFQTWKKRLRNDCIAVNKGSEFDGFGESVLKILYENGLDPTVEAIIKSRINGKAPGEKV